MFEVCENNALEFEQHIDIPYAIDNLSEDQDGTIWAAAITHGPKFFKHAKDPFSYTPPSTILKVQRKENNEYEFQKVLEDRDGEVLPGTTTVVHDIPSGRLFMSGELQAGDIDNNRPVPSLTQNLMQADSHLSSPFVMQCKVMGFGLAGMVYYSLFTQKMDHSTHSEISWIHWD